MSLPAYTVVIATMDRPAAVREVLDCLGRQTHPPAEVRIVDASEDAATAALATAWRTTLPLHYERAARPSAARQRNQGAAGVTTPLIAFLDDDIAFEPEVMARLAGTFVSAPATAGVAARIAGPGHPVPGALLRFYYRLQAGYPHPHYGGRLFGAAINCFPCYRKEAGPLVAAEWLNAGLVVFRTPAFLATPFPDFEGYSFMEDVYASVRIRQHAGPLYFRADATYVHYDLPNRFKRDQRALARHRMINRARLARDLLGLRGVRLQAKLLLHRLFLTAVLLRARPAGWTRELAGTWQ